MLKESILIKTMSQGPILYLINLRAHLSVAGEKEAVDWRRSKVKFEEGFAIIRQ